MMFKPLVSTAALVLLSAIVGSPVVTQANSNSPLLLSQQQADAPQIDSFTVNSVNQLAPGTELVFILEGTPGSRASLTLSGVATNLPMREIEPGVYQGRYTIRSRDKISANTIVRANLQRGDLVSSSRLQQPLVTNQTSTTPTNPNTTSTNPGTTQTNQSLFIDRFTVQPVQQLEPGEDLRFTLVGTPNAKATFSIEGITYNQPMQETTPGTYQGQYVIRRQDDFSATGVNVTASLQANNQIARAKLGQNLVAGATTTPNTNTSSLPLEITSPQANSRVSGTVEITGRSAPNTTIAVNVKAVNSVAGLIGFNRNILNRSIQSDAQGNFRFTFNPNLNVPGTRYEVSLSATRDNQTREETLVLLQR
jgi:hypothetical protein